MEASEDFEEEDRGLGHCVERNGVLGSTKLPMLIVRSTEAEAAIRPQKELVQQGTL